MNSVKKLSIALALGAIALAAAGANPASAESPGWFTAENYPVKIPGTQTSVHGFYYNGGHVECNVFSLAAAESKKAPSLKANATYGECAGPNSVASFSMNGCEYEFVGEEELPRSEEEIEEEVPVRHRASLNIISKPGRSCTTEPISIASLSCTVTIGPQSGKKEVVFTNEGAGATRHLHMNIEIGSSKGITFTQGGFCVSGTFKEGILFGQANLAGWNEKGQEGLWVE
jgi:hypothetical protein